MDMLLDSRNKPNYKETAKHLSKACDDYCVAIDYNFIRIEPDTHSARMMDLVKGPVGCTQQLILNVASSSNSKE